MVPAQQRFEAHDAPRVELHHRLVIDAELMLGHSRPQIGFEAQPAHRTRVHGFIENFAARSAQSLCPAHGHVGIFQHVLGALVRWSAQGNPNAYRNSHFAVLDVKGLGHRRLNAPRHAHGIAGIAHRVEQHGEFVPTQPEQHNLCRSSRTVSARDGVVLPQGFA